MAEFGRFIEVGAWDFNGARGSLEDCDRGSNEATTKGEVMI